MKVARKFSFDQVFDSNHETDPEEPEAAAPPPEPTFTREEVAAAREQGYAEGREAGAAEAQASIENVTAAALAQISQEIATLGPEVSEGMLRCRQDAIGIACAITRKMVEQAAGERAQIMVEAAISDVLPRIIDEPRVVVRVSDELLDPLRQRIPMISESSGFPGSLILLAEHGLARPDCRIEWADGGAEYDSERLWSEIDEVVERYRAEIGAASGGALPMTAAGGGHTNSEEHDHG